MAWHAWHGGQVMPAGLAGPAAMMGAPVAALGAAWALAGSTAWAEPWRPDHDGQCWDGTGGPRGLWLRDDDGDDDDAEEDAPDPGVKPGRAKPGRGKPNRPDRTGPGRKPGRKPSKPGKPQTLETKPAFVESPAPAAPPRASPTPAAPVQAAPVQAAPAQAAPAPTTTAAAASWARQSGSPGGGASRGRGVYTYDTAAIHQVRYGDASLNWGRWQYDFNSGYCGEVSIQTLMMPHGAWIPQWLARDLGTGGNQSIELILENNAEGNLTRALKALGIRYDIFAGTNYQAFVQWGKQHLKNGVGFIYVTFNTDGANDEYDHITPMVGLSKDERHWYSFTGYETKAVQTAVNAYSCTNKNKRDYREGGCVPKDTKWGIAVLGPAYLGIGPPVELLHLSSPDEGTTTNKNKMGLTMRCIVRVHGLTPGKTYAVHKIDDHKKIPKAKGQQPGGAVVKTFTAQGADFSFESSFDTRKAAYYVCVETK